MEEEKYLELYLDRCAAQVSPEAVPLSRSQGPHPAAELQGLGLF
jgi:hypothetical protein